MKSLFDNKPLVVVLWAMAMATFYFTFHQPANTPGEYEPRVVSAPSEQPARRSPPAAAMAPTAMAPATVAPAPTPAAAAGGPTLSGQIDLAPALKNKVQATDTIFVIVRRQASGPPMAAKKLPVTTFPFRYEVSSSDLMMGGPFEGEVELTVRVDKDGNAMSKNPGDLFGTSKRKLTVGETKADVVIDSELP